MNFIFKLIIRKRVSKEISKACEAIDFHHTRYQELDKRGHAGRWFHLQMRDSQRMYREYLQKLLA